MDRRHQIVLIGGEDGEQAVFAEDSSHGTCKLTCAYRGKTIEAEASDFFEALCLVRHQLEPEGLIPFCYGASLNVYPSGMARDMGRGLKAYRLTKGKSVNGADIVETFGTGPDVVPASVQAQETFWREWLSAPPRVAPRP
ncbi:hypothetical protein [Inquilinus limosus]|uniref:Uncharacterized protein n=1 Tax=Inquilinus limosus TaxID=171674 RepID=A0A211Z1F5_9PROT|nr:hypothetical protein [Inquilinus limosus]OWJ59078.1 hypothetical protein BWR60_32550 [Inquilinus limosus]